MSSWWSGNGAGSRHINHLRHPANSTATSYAGKSIQRHIASLNEQISNRIDCQKGHKYATTVLALRRAKMTSWLNGLVWASLPVTSLSHYNRLKRNHDLPACRSLFPTSGSCPSILDRRNRKTRRQGQKQGLNPMRPTWSSYTCSTSGRLSCGSGN